MNVKYENLIPTGQHLGILCKMSTNIEDLLTHMHIHDEVELVYVFDGKLNVQIDDTVQILGKDDLIVLNRLAPHQFSRHKNDSAKFLVLQFKPIRLFDNKIVDVKYLEPFFHTRKVVYYYGNKQRDKLDEFINTMISIQQEIEISTYAYELAVYSEMLKLLYLFHNIDIFINNERSNIKDKYINRIASLLKYLDTHYSDEITVNTACEFVQLDYHYFSRLFKQETGKNFIEYLNMKRILAAQNMLSTTDLAVQFIAESVGIPNATYFNRLFKKHTGIRPTEYRKKFSNDTKYTSPS